LCRIGFACAYRLGLLRGRLARALCLVALARFLVVTAPALR
jgi:hypothetical protein